MSIEAFHDKIYAMKTTMTYLIQQHDTQKTAEQFLLSNGYSAALIRRLRRTEHSILKNGSPIYTTHRLNEGDTLSVTLPEDHGSENILPIPMTEQAKVLAGLEQESELHLALVYRGTAENASAFIEAQDALIEELYAEPEAEEGGEKAEDTETEESEGTVPTAESEATAE